VLVYLGIWRTQDTLDSPPPKDVVGYMQRIARVFAETKVSLTFSILVDWRLDIWDHISDGSYAYSLPKAIYFTLQLRLRRPNAGLNRTRAAVRKARIELQEDEKDGIRNPYETPYKNLMEAYRMLKEMFRFIRVAKEEDEAKREKERARMERRIAKGRKNNGMNRSTRRNENDQ
jgi:hypothetical protein